MLPGIRRKHRFTVSTQEVNIMASDQEKTGQQGGSAQNDSGGLESDWPPPTEPDQGAGRMSESESDLQGDAPPGGQQVGGGYPSDHQGAVGAAHRRGMGGHTTGPKSDNGQSEIGEASQAVQDEDSGMTEDNR